MADGAPVMVWLSGPDGGRTYVNQRWLDFTGRGLDHELGESWMAGVHRDDQPDLARTLAAALAEERPFTVEYRLQRRDGEYRWVLDHGVPRRSDDGALLGYVGSAVDVTQLRAAQRALLETDLLRSAIFGALHGQVAALDKSGRIIAVNHAWGRFALENGGNPVRVSIGASYLDVCRDAAAAGDRDAGRILGALRTVLAGGTPLEIEYACRTPAGERWFEMTAEPLRRPEGGAARDSRRHHPPASGGGGGGASARGAGSRAAHHDARGARRVAGSRDQPAARRDRGERPGDAPPAGHGPGVPPGSGRDPVRHRGRCRSGPPRSSGGSGPCSARSWSTGAPWT